jgi:hypothetical protein
MPDTSSKIIELARAAALQIRLARQAALPTSAHRPSVLVMSNTFAVSRATGFDTDSLATGVEIVAVATAPATGLALLAHTFLIGEAVRIVQALHALRAVANPPGTTAGRVGGTRILSVTLAGIALPALTRAKFAVALARSWQTRAALFVRLALSSAFDDAAAIRGNRAIHELAGFSRRNQVSFRLCANRSQAGQRLLTIGRPLTRFARATEAHSRLVRIIARITTCAQHTYEENACRDQSESL